MMELHKSYVCAVANTLAKVNLPPTILFTSKSFNRSTTFKVTPIYAGIMLDSFKYLLHAQNYSGTIG